jgi:hypothetical protein
MFASIASRLQLFTGLLSDTLHKALRFPNNKIVPSTSFVICILLKSEKVALQTSALKSFVCVDLEMNDHGRMHAGNGSSRTF